MKQITEIELKIILDNHKLWIESEQKQGKQANLAYANLQGADLKDANLQGANLVGANLAYANLYEANLVAANLEDANLYEANLVAANLEDANLEGTILEKKEKIAPATTNPPNNLRSKFDEFAKSLGVKIVSLKIEKTEIIDL